MFLKRWTRRLQSTGDNQPSTPCIYYRNSLVLVPSATDDESSEDLMDSQLGWIAALSACCFYCQTLGLGDLYASLGYRTLHGMLQIRWSDLSSSLSPASCPIPDQQVQNSPRFFGFRSLSTEQNRVACSEKGLCRELSVNPAYLGSFW